MFGGTHVMPHLSATAYRRIETSDTQGSRQLISWTRQKNLLSARTLPKYKTAKSGTPSTIQIEPNKSGKLHKYVLQ
jgi:hypothetical protein